MRAETPHRLSFGERLKILALLIQVKQSSPTPFAFTLCLIRP